MKDHKRASGANGLSVEKAVAIIGVACRLPGGVNSLAELWSVLVTGADLVTEIPGDRFDARQLVDPVPGRAGKVRSVAGGYLDDVAGFDADFFGLSPAEASRLDPQHRIAMELAVEAVDDAGIDVVTLAGSDTAVVMGAGNVDYLELQHYDLKTINPYTNLGGLLCHISARISHALDLRGPCMTIDTACSASLTALHQVCIMLASGEAGLGVVGGVNAILNPGNSVGAAQASIISPTGRCHAFSESADGYVRAEGGVVVVVKPLDAAVADGDRIRAVIVGTAVNFDGRTQGMSQPRVQTQEALLRKVYPGCGVDPADVAYVEAHGTGTLVGDAVECAALGAVLGRGRSAPLPIGSVKTNVGHLETAAGLVGLLKALLVLEHQHIPPTLHAVPLSTRIDFAELGLAPAIKPQPLAPTRRTTVAVNSFGIGGANAHAAVIAPPETPDLPGTLEHPSVETHLLPVIASGRTPRAAAQAAEFLADRIADAAGCELYDLCYTACRRRTAHLYRIAAIGRTGAELADRLVAAAPPATPAHLDTGVAFIFCGNGSQWTGMGMDLLREDSAFATALREVDAAARPHLGWSIIESLTGDMARSTTAVPTLFAVQVSLVAALSARGVAPAAVLGHSVGELAAAHVSGALSLDTACRLVAVRAQCVESAAGAGGMAALGVSEQRALDLVAQSGGAIELAAVNGSTEVTLCGDIAALDRCANEGTFYRRLAVNYPYHSRAMEGPAAELRAALADLSAGALTVPMISTVTGELVADNELDAEYWSANLVRPVRFADAVDEVITRHQVLLEIGPHPVLRGYLRGREGITALSTLDRQADGLSCVDAAAAAVLAAGGRLDWAQYFPQPGRVIDLPRYPWQRERCWNGDPMALTPRPVHPLLGVRQPTAEPTWTGSLDQARTPWLAEHVIEGATILPASGYVELALAAGREVLAEPAEVGHLELLGPISITTEDPQVHVAVAEDDGLVRIFSRPADTRPWQLHARGRVRRLRTQPPPDVNLAPWRDAPVTVATGEFYRQACATGYGWHGLFQVLRDIRRLGDQLCARYAFTGRQQDYEVHPALLDATMQAALLMLREVTDRLALPSFVGRARLWEQPAAEGLALVRRRVRSEDHLVVDVLVTDTDGRVSIELTNVRLQCVGEAHQDAPETLTTVLRATAQQPARSTTPPVLPQPRFTRHDVFLTAAATVTAHFTAHAFGQLTETWTVRSLSENGMLPKHGPLARALAAAAVTAGVLVQIGEDAWEPATDPNPRREFSRALIEFGEYSEYWALAGHCGQRLPDVLRGTCDPLDLHAPPQQGTGAEAFYTSEILFGEHYRAVGEVLAGIAAAAPADAGLRVLEVDAGTGRATAQLLPALNPQRTRYTITDTSPIFVRRATTLLAAYDWVDVRQFDPETLPEAGFDVVVAVMARPAAVGHVARLLIDGGWLVVLAPHDATWWNPIFGLLDGWGPRALVRSPDEWIKALRDNDFGHTDQIGHGALSILVARRDSRAPRTAPAPVPGPGWVVRGSGSLADALSAAASGPAGGHTVLLANALATNPVHPVADQIVTDLAALRATSQALRDLPSARLSVVCPASGLFDLGELDGPVAAGLWGAARCLANEQPALPVRRIAVGANVPAHRVAQALNDPCDEDEIVLTAHGQFVPRVVPVADIVQVAVVEQPVQLTVGGTPALRWERFELPAPGPGEVLLRVNATSWNYRDVLIARGELQFDVSASEAIGTDCAGVVLAAGHGANWRPGDRVFGWARRAFASHALADARFLAPIPPGMDPTAAATLPTVWHTVHHSLVHRAGLRRGQTILIHGGAGGVGIAAIRFAQQTGATVITTAGTAEKRALLRLLGVEQVRNSRDLSFADEILACTDGRGVDVVLNSLAGEGLDRSLRLVCPGGHFVELGKLDLRADSRLAMGSLAASVTVHLVDLDIITTHDLDGAAAEMAEVFAAVTAGDYRPLPYRVYTPDRIGDAFDLLAHSRHVGKVVIRLDDATTTVPVSPPVSPPRFKPHASYLLTGGTSGFGAATAVWLAEHGARHLVAIGRRGAAAPDVEQTVTAVRAHGAELRVIACDVTDRPAMTELLAGINATGHPLRGVVHSAAVMHDAPLAELDDAALREVIAPKVTGAALLDELTSDLDFTWYYSSLSTVLGNIHQTNYVAANLHLDAMARARRAAGRPGLSIGWGLIGDVGLALREPEEFAAELFTPVTARASLQALATVPGGDHAVLGIGRPHWSRVGELLPRVDTPRLSLLAADAAAGSAATAHTLGQAIRTADPDRAMALTTEAVTRILAKALETVPERIDPHRSISQLGLDSLMAVQIQTGLWRLLQCDLPAMRIMTSGGVGELARSVYAQVTDTQPIRHVP